MGMLLFTLLLIAEAALAVRRAGTNSIQRRATALLRGASLLVLGALAALSAVEWGARYYALAAVLALLTAVNAVQLLRKRASGEARGRARVLGRAVLMAALLFAASLPAILFPEYAPLPTTGEYGVRTAVRHFADESRTEAYTGRGVRTLAAEFWYPEGAAERIPLVVFSHGALGTRDSNETLFRELASHGYVVCSVDHTYECLYTTGEGGEPLLIDGGYMRELRGENAREDKQNSLALYRKWMGTRTADIRFVLDAVASEARANPRDELFGLVDIEKTGVMGHSLGGAAALGIGRERGDIGAVIALEAPFLCDILGVEDDVFVWEDADYPAPLLSVYSDSAWPYLAEWPQYAENARLLGGADEDAYSLHLAGTGHLSLTDLSLASPILTRVFNGRPSSTAPLECLLRLNELCLSFFNCFLKGGAPFQP